MHDNKERSRIDCLEALSSASRRVRQIFGCRAHPFADLLLDGDKAEGRRFVNERMRRRRLRGRRCGLDLFFLFSLRYSECLYMMLSPSVDDVESRGRLVGYKKKASW